MYVVLLIGLSKSFLPVIFSSVPWPHDTPESHQEIQWKEDQRKAVSPTKTNQGLQLTWLAHCQISAQDTLD